MLFKKKKQLTVYFYLHILPIITDGCVDRLVLSCEWFPGERKEKLHENHKLMSGLNCEWFVDKGRDNSIIQSISLYTQIHVRPELCSC